MSYFWLKLTSKFKILLISATVAIGSISNQPTQAQLTPDDSLGEESSTVTPDVEVKGETADRIDGGAIRDRNLFHSFSEFNVGEAQRVYFANPDNIEQIFTRVTGNSPSNINGTLGVDGAADLLLLNPNGIIFGENSFLDVEGSFFGTTADSVLFEDGEEFSASEPNSSLLTVSVPLGLQVGNNPGAIKVRSPLKVPNGQNFTLLGGDISLSGGNIVINNNIKEPENGITAPGGKVELGSLAASGVVEIKASGSLNFPQEIPKADVLLSNFAVDVSAGGGGSIAVNAKNLELFNSELVAGIDASVELASGQAGDIVIDTTEKVLLDSSDDSGSAIGNITGDFSAFSDLENIEIVNTAGNAGNIFINTDSLSVTGSSLILSITNGEGNAGDINLNAKSWVSINSLEPLDLSESSTSIRGIVSGVGELGIGNGADIEINTPFLSLNNASISTSTIGAGNAGNTLIDATDSVVVNDSLIIAEATSSGNGANIEIDTRALSLNNARISTSTVGAGNAGNTMINATDSISFLNTVIAAETLSSGDAGDIVFESEIADISLEESIISTTVSSPIEQFVGTGRGGDITIEGRNLFMTNNSLVTTATGGKVIAEGLANAGDLELNITDTITLSNESVLATSTLGEGNAGDISLNTKELTVDNSIVSTANANAGQAGNLKIKASEFVNLSGTFVDADKDITPGGLFTSTTDGEAAAGDLTVNTGELTIANGAQIQAATFGSGDGGNINVLADLVQLTGNSGEDFPSAITAFTDGAGNGGAIDIITNSLTINDEAGISVRSVENGSAGFIFASIENTLEVDNGFIASFSDRSSGGEISISAGSVSLKGDSDIRTNVESGAGGGGNITLSADSIVAFDDSDILANSADGKGGDITLDTDAFFAANYSFDRRDANPQLDNNNRVDLSATGSIDGTIDIPEVNFLPNNLVKLSEDTIDSEEVVANSCVVRSTQPGGTFIVTGSGGLPMRPADATVSDYATGTVRAIPEKETSEEDNRKLESIAEPEGVYQLANGKLVLSRECR